MQNETNMETEIKYLLVEYFEFANKEIAQKYDGHPKAGGLYRGFTTSDGTLALKLPGLPAPYKGLIIEGLEGDYSAYSCKLHEITTANMMDYNLTDDQLDQIVEWNETKNADMKADFELADRKEPELEEIITAAIQKQIDDEMTQSKEFNKALDTIDFFDPFLMEALSDTIDHISGVFEKHHYERQDIRDDFSYHPSDVGKGFNIGSARKYLQRYMTEGYEKSNNPMDLYKAIHFLLFELSRRLQNG